MATIPADEFSRHVRRIALLGDGAGMSDGQLLECYIRKRDEANFAALLRRHGPMVWGVCRRILGNHHDAEDAFQATFLVLVRKATTIVPRDMVGNWLYGVAHQTARKARAMNTRRNTRERPMATTPEPGASEPVGSTDLQALLDQELSRLPEKYRTVVVLCDLSGKSYKEAARQIGCPQGTLAARLARARAMLARRLARQGITVSAAGLGAALTRDSASAALPAAVAASTIKKIATGAVAAPVAALAEGVLKAMLLSKLKVLLGGLVAVAVLLGAVAASRWENRANAAEAKPPTPPEKRTDQSPEKGRKRLLRWQLKFNTQHGDEYASQLEALGAQLAIPTAAENRYQIIRDLSKRPAKGTVEDLSRVEHIFWLEDNARSIASLSKALGLKPVPKHVVVFLPRFIEDELLRKELAYAREKRDNIKEKDIRETQFEFVRTRTGYDIRVASQQLD